jgi:phosphoribosylanthranilate isomerase
MTWVKICGITNLEDARTAVDAGADAVGFVFYEKSPRKISVDAARAIVEKLPESVEKVGVFVGELPPQAVTDIVKRARLTSIQIYSGAALVGAAQWHEAGLKLLMAIRAEDLIEGDVIIGEDFAELFYAALLDSGSGERPGGTGERFDWGSSQIAVQGLAEVLPVVVAGGLTSCNVEEAIKLLKPWGVDVASGVEASPGKKDPEKVRAFVRAVREADRKTS